MYEESAVMEATGNENWQRHERGAECACNQICGRRQLADVEFQVSDHAPIGGDLRLHVDEIGCHTLDRDFAGTDSARLGMLCDCEVQWYERLCHDHLRGHWCRRRSTVGRDLRGLKSELCHRP